jgi:hypothetical protein
MESRETKTSPFTRASISFSQHRHWCSRDRTDSVGREVIRAVCLAALDHGLKWFHIDMAGYHLGRWLGDPCEDNLADHLQSAIRQLQEEVEEGADDEGSGAKIAQVWLKMLAV